MKPFRILFLSVVAITLLSAFLPSEARAGTISVNQADTANCISAASFTTSTYCNIQAAIETAVTNSSATLGGPYSVLVEPGSYTESLNLQGITVQGREAARTFLSGTVTAASGSSSFSGFFLGNSSTINIQSGATLDVTNNIFDSLTTAVTIASSGSRIVNNVFYNNTTAISSTVDNIIINNIFYSNTTAITASVSLTNVSFNCFYPSTGKNALVGITITTFPDANGNRNTNPNLASITNGDFHLTNLSTDYIGTGNSTYSNTSFDVNSAVSDYGAYGGPNADTILFLVSGLSGTADTSTSSITLTWTENTDYHVAGYHIYYGTATGQYSASATATGAGTTSAVLSNLTASTTQLTTAPTLTVSNIMNQSLELTWTAVDGATGYVVYYGIDDGTSSAPTASSVTIADATTTTTLTGLTNNQNYKIVVYAYSQAAYYIAITAFDDSSSGPFSPGVTHESALSIELPLQFGDTQFSPVSNMIVDFPEALVAYPTLPSTGQGCFIATAAYGFYSAPQVQALRTFRDRYLATNSGGRTFVNFYYTYSPAAAAWLNNHPGFKPAVRAGLMPFVGAALFMTQTSFLVKVVVFAVLMLLAGIIIRQKRMSAARRLRPE